jgi:seryl-tRNA synthetase
MSAAILNVVMDFVVLAALAGTIFYAMRLTRSLENFKSSRNELKDLILQLSQNIDKAQDSIAALKKASNAGADDLENVLHDSRKMADELKMINEASNAMAGRLERLASDNRRASPVQDFEDYDDEDEMEDEPPSNTLKAPSFFIQDRDVDEDDPEDDKTFSSQAEKDLYNALQKNKKASGGRK